MPIDDKDIKANKSCVLWLTGLPGAGKTSIASVLHGKLGCWQYKVAHLDGDNFRQAQKERLGFSKDDRNRNIYSAALKVNTLTLSHDIIIVSFVTPYLEQRNYLKNNLMGYVEVFVYAPSEICEQRDPKGLYKKARAGEIRNFTGIDDPYEPPLRPDIHLRTYNSTIDECVNTVLDYLHINDFIKLK